MQAKVGIRLNEASIPIDEEVRGACEILGLDPLYVANEGKCLVIVAREAGEAVLAALQAHPLGREAALIGEVVADHPGRVVHAQPHRRPADRGHAQRRTVAEDLLDACCEEFTTEARRAQRASKKSRSSPARSRVAVSPCRRVAVRLGFHPPIHTTV